MAVEYRQRLIGLRNSGYFEDRRRRLVEQAALRTGAGRSRRGTPGAGPVVSKHSSGAEPSRDDNDQRELTDENRDSSHRRIDSDRTRLQDRAQKRPDSGDAPLPIKEACQRYCPDSFYQILRITEHQNTKPHTYTVTFINNNGMIQGKKLGDDLTSELPQYKLELTADGQIIEEERHLISMLAVPKAVRIAYQKWNPKGLQGMTVAWASEKPRNKDRQFSASIVFNQVDGSFAVFHGRRNACQRKVGSSSRRAGKKALSRLRPSRSSAASRKPK